MTRWNLGRLAWLATLGVHVEACSNEASAAAMLGASIHYPLRGAVTWKSIVGTNVAADALSNLASPGVVGGAVVGGVVVAPHASELIHSIAVAVSQRVTVEDFSHSFTVYPSMSGSIAEAARRLHGVHAEVAADDVVIVPPVRAMHADVPRAGQEVLAPRHQRAALAAAVDAGRLRENAAREVRPPKPRAAVHEPWTFLEPAEVAAVTGCPEIPDPERTIYTVAIYTGLRLGELWGLRWEDVRLDGDRPEVTVRRSHAGATKSGKVRRVPLLPQARAALDALAGRRDGWVFPGEHGQRRRDDDARWSPGWRFVDRASGARERVAVNGYRLRAGITRRVRFHDLRHTCASHLLMGTWGVRLPIEEVSAWLGHSSTAVTQRYAHLAPDHLSARVAEAFRAPVPPLSSPAEGSSGGTAATRSLPRKPLENQRRAMQESNLRPSASETDGCHTNPAGTQAFPAPSVPPQSHAAAVLVLAARGETLPAGLLTGLARAAIVAGVRGDLALALLDGAGDHAARLAVDLAAALLEVPAVARATG